MTEFTSTLTRCDEFQLTLPDNHLHPPIVVYAQTDQVIRVYGVGMKSVTLTPGDRRAFETQQYWMPLAILRLLLDLPIYYWRVCP